MAIDRVRRRNVGPRLLALLAVLLGLIAAPAAHAAHAAHGAQKTSAAAPFNVLAFYNGTWDDAHISFVKEANTWFPQQAAANNFSYTATNNWEQLTSITKDQYQVVIFLDDAPKTAAQRSGFERYMRGGGAWLGFHVSAFTTNAGAWPWYYNDFLGTGNFKTNTWGPTTATLKVEDRTHPSTVGLPATFTSSVSEWYGWTNNLRARPDIKVLSSVDPVSFPLGTDPNQSWYSGDYPIMWTNSGYKMIYANFGHNAMNYSTGQTLSYTFGSATQNRFVLDGLKWLGTGTGSTTPPGPIDETAWYSLVNSGNSLCVDARSAATANGTAIQQYTCNGTQAQQYQLRSTDSGFSRIGPRANAQQAVDVTDVSTADNAPIQLWSYSGGLNQQWQAVAETTGRYHFAARHSGKCLSAPAGAGSGTQLVQRPCDGSAAQSFQLVRQP